MKSINELINEVKKDIVKDGIPDMTEKTKVPKQYLINLEGQTHHFLPEFLSKWYGYINMWLEKNAAKIVTQCDKDNIKLPTELKLTFPMGLTGVLKLEWSSNNGPYVDLTDAELKPSYVINQQINTSSFYLAMEDFKLFKLRQQIEVNVK